MEIFENNYIGFIHFFSSILALIFGSMVLIKKKGTRTHIKLGYAYLFSMVTLLATSFMLYKLFNGFGIFHYASILSLVTLILGIIPVLTKKPKNKWLVKHFSFMYWSVIGLYAAFVSEIFTRIPGSPFVGMLIVATVIILIIGGIFFIRNKQKWQNIYNK